MVRPPCGVFALASLAGALPPAQPGLTGGLVSANLWAEDSQTWRQASLLPVTTCLHHPRGSAPRGPAWLSSTSWRLDCGALCFEEAVRWARTDRSCADCTSSHGS